MKHTKEPWRVVSDVPVKAIYSESEDYRVVQTVNQNNFNTYGKSRVDVGIYKQEDADRIVACINACAGITDAVIEDGIIKKALIAYLGSYDKGTTWNNMKVWEDV